MKDTSSYPIGFFMSRTYAKLKTHFQKRLKTYRITPEQWLLFIVLSEEDGISLTELSQISIRDKPSTTRLVDKLEKKKLIRREKNENDKRSTLLFLTKKGGDIKREIFPIVLEINKQVTKTMSEEEVQQLKFLLNKMYDQIKDE